MLLVNTSFYLEVNSKACQICQENKQDEKQIFSIKPNKFIVVSAGEFQGPDQVVLMSRYIFFGRQKGQTFWTPSTNWQTPAVGGMLFSVLAG